MLQSLFSQVPPPEPTPGGLLALAPPLLLGAAAVYLLLPRPRQFPERTAAASVP